MVLKPSVAIVTGSKADFPAMMPAIDLLQEFEVQHQLLAIDPHRTRQEVINFAEQARAKGFRFILAGTGDSPDLPSPIAKHTVLPVVGVPIPCNFAKSDGPTYSMVNMPADVPISTVSSGDARSAALTAVRTLALGDKILDAKLMTWQG